MHYNVQAAEEEIDRLNKRIYVLNKDVEKLESALALEEVQHRTVRQICNEANERITKLTVQKQRLISAIQSNCYDDSSASGKRLMELASRLA